MNMTEKYDVLQWTITDEPIEEKSGVKMVNNFRTVLKFSVIKKTESSFRSWGMQTELPSEYLGKMADACQVYDNYTASTRGFRKKLAASVDRIADNAEFMVSCDKLASNVIMVRYNYRVLVVDIKTGFSKSYQLQKMQLPETEQMLKDFKKSKNAFAAVHDGKYSGVAKVASGTANEVVTHMLHYAEDERPTSPKLHQYIANMVAAYQK